MCWRSTSRNMHTARTCNPHQPMAHQAMAKFDSCLRGSRSVLFLRPAERLCYYSTSVPRGLAVTLRLASRQAAAKRTDRGEWKKWTCTRISSLALDQEWLVIKVVRGNREARGGIRKKEREQR